MQVAADVAQRHEMRQPAAPRGVHLALVFAQFRRHRGKAEAAVKLRLRPSGEQLLALEQPVFVELPAALDGKLAQRDVVRLGTREIHQRRAVARLRHHAQVHLQPVAQPHRRARRPLFHHLRDVLVAGEAPHHLLPAGRGDHDVEVAHRLAPPAEAAGDLRERHAGRSGDVGQQRQRDLLRGGELGARRRGCTRGDGAQHPRLGTRPDARHLAQPARLRRGLQLRDAVDAERLLQKVHPLRPQPRQAQQFRDAGRHLACKLVEQRQMPALRDHPDLVGEIAPDARQVVEILARREHVRDRARQPLDQPRRAAIGADTERIGALDVEEVGDLVELLGDLGVGHGHAPALLL